MASMIAPLTTLIRTFGELRRFGQRLEIGCRACGVAIVVAAHDLPFGDHEQLPPPDKKLECSRCGEKHGYARPVPAISH